MEKESSDSIEKREKIFLKWIKKDYNYLLLSLIIFTVLIRIYYLFLTKDQPIWWDGAEYMNMGKAMAFNLPYSFDAVRPVFFSFIVSLLYHIPETEFLTRIFVVLLSITSIIFTYLLGKEMFDKKIGIFASFLLSVYYIQMFFSFRILMDIPSLAFFTLSAYFFYNYFKNNSIKSLYIGAVAIGIGTMAKQNTAFFLLIILIYLLFTEKLKFLYKKEIYISALIYWITISPYVIWGYIKFHGFVLAKSAAEVTPSGNLFTHTLQLLSTYLVNFPTYVFNLGQDSSLWLFSGILLIIIFLFSIYKLVIGFDVLLKDNLNNKELKRDLYLLLIFIIPMITVSAFIGHTEDRYIINAFPAFFIMIGFFCFSVYNFLEKKKLKIIGIIFIILVIVFFAYSQLKASNDLIKNKIPSYKEIKQAGIWLRQNTLPTDIIATKSQAQIKYYSNREVMFFPSTKEEFELNLSSNPNIKYFVLSAYETSFNWTYPYPQEKNMSVVQVYAMNNQPAVIIYKIR